jgi:hypothetical protein
MEVVMRMLLRAVFDTEAVNETVRDGSAPETLNQIMGLLKPEAAYFISEEGQRTCLVVFDLADPAQIPVICEPLFLGTKAKITLTPCMTVDDVRKGLSEVVRQAGAQR